MAVRQKINVFLLLMAIGLLAGCAGTSSDGGSYSWGWYIFNPLEAKGVSNLQFLAGGIWATILVSLCAIGLSVILGAVVAMAGLSGNKHLKLVSRGYVELFRSVPLLVLLLWVFYGLPVSDSAFEAEVFRAGIQSVPKGQIEAAKSLGLTWAQQMRFVVFPQAIKIILPALGNQFVYVIKMSSLVSVIGLQEFTRRANELNVNEYRPLEIYTLLVVEYLVLILVVSYLVRRMERRLTTTN